MLSGFFLYYKYYIGYVNVINPLEALFPINTGCSMKYIEFSGDSNNIEALCTMSMNPLYYYVLPPLWLFLASLSVLLTASYIFELLIVAFKFVRRGFMACVAIAMKGYKYRWEYDAIWKNASPAEYHIIRLYSMNADPQIVRLFLIALVKGDRKLTKYEKKLLNKID